MRIMPSLYVTEPGSRLHLEGGRLLCLLNDEVLLAAPSGRVDRVILVAGAQITTPVMTYLLDRRIRVLFVTRSGACRGTLEHDPGVNLDLRRTQYVVATDPAQTLTLAKAFLAGKLANSRTRAMELDQSDDPADRLDIDRIAAALRHLDAAPDLATAMGCEGRAARAYFAVLGRHLRAPWTFTRRARRPPPDPVNAVLSVVYTLLHEQCRTALLAVGFDPACGFLHQPRSGRAALAMDLMEEFRPVIADPVAWSLFNLRILNPDDFERAANQGGIQLSARGWRCLAEHYERRLGKRILIPGRATRTTYRKLIEIQAHALARAVMHPEDPYDAYRSR
jgi:CRISPR-associated protein Cas1